MVMLGNNESSNFKEYWTSIMEKQRLLETITCPFSKIGDYRSGVDIKLTMDVLDTR